MNTLNIQTTMTSTVDNVRTVVSSNRNTPCSSSNFTAGSKTLGSAGWGLINDFSTLTDVAGFTILNDDDTQYSASVIKIATGSSGGNVIAVLIPGAAATIPWSGSHNGIYGKVTGGYAGVATPASGSVQYLAQQS